MKLFRLFLLVVLWGLPGNASGQHLLVYDSISHRQEIIPLNRKVWVKAHDFFKPVKGTLYNIDDSGLYVLSTKFKGWINFNELEFISVKKTPNSGVIVGAVISAAALTGTIFLADMPKTEGGNPAGLIAKLLSPVTVVIIPLMIGHAVDNSEPPRTFYIGKSASLKPVRKVKKHHKKEGKVT